MENNIPFLSFLTFANLIKFPLLIIVALYLLFSFILFNQVGSLNKIITINQLNASFLLRFAAFLYMIAVLGLFLTAIVIL